MSANPTVFHSEHGVCQCIVGYIVRATWPVSACVSCKTHRKLNFCQSACVIPLDNVHTVLRADARSSQAD